MNRYDQFLQGVKNFAHQLDTIPTQNSAELDNRFEVYEYYHKTSIELHRQLKQDLEKAKEKPQEIARIVTLIQKIADADRILHNIEGKIDTITQRLFPQNKQGDLFQEHPITSSKEAELTVQHLIGEASELGERIEVFKNGITEQVQNLHLSLSASEKKECQRIIEGMRKEIATIRVAVGQNRQQNVELVHDLLRASEESLKAVEQLVNAEPSAGSSSKRTHQTKATPRAILALGSEARRAHNPVMQEAWVYDEQGRSIPPDLGQDNMIQIQIRKGKLAAPHELYQRTQGIWNVLGDGCCGYYSYAALLIQKAIHEPLFKRKIIAQIEHVASLWDDSSEEVPFEDQNNIRMVNKREVVRQLIALFNSLDPSSNLNAVLTKENGQLLNLFFRIALREGMAMGILDDFRAAFNETDDQEYSLSDGFANQYIEIEEPVVNALNLLLNMNIEIIRLEKNALVLPRRHAHDGYLLHTGGHYMAAFPRRDRAGKK